ncbi:MAG: hypothetical protein R3D84_15820 [Paracoccaceae bacterium]
MNNANRAAIAQIMQANLAEIGLTVELNGQDEGTFWAVTKNVPRLCNCMREKLVRQTRTGFIRCNTSSPIRSASELEGDGHLDYDALVEKARETVDEGERAAIYVHSFRHMLEGALSFPDP